MKDTMINVMQQEAYTCEKAHSSAYLDFGRLPKEGVMPDALP